MTKSIARLLIYVCLFAAGSALACSFKEENGSLEIDDRERNYEVFRPEHATGPLPLVIGLHGGYGTGERFESHAGLLKVKGAKEFVFVFPDGYRHSWNAGRCCGSAEKENVDDVKFLRALIDKLVAQGYADPARVYITGFSNGAKMAYRAACEMSDKLRAIAPVGGSADVEEEFCKPTKPVAVLHIHGDADKWAPLHGGTGVREKAGVQNPVADGVRGWAKINGCTHHQPEVERLAGAECSTHTGCQRNAEVTQCIVSGMGHQWPGDEPSAMFKRTFGPPAPQIPASEFILQFFRLH